MALFYKYVAVPQVAATAAAQRSLSEQLALTGRIRLAGEGINGLLAGPEQVLSAPFAVRSHSLSHSVSVSQSLSHSVTHPATQSVSQSVSQSLTQPLSQSVSHSVSQSATQSVSQPISGSACLPS